MSYHMCQGTVDTTRLEIYLAICKPARRGHPIHWIIMLVHPGATRCIWYHTVGYPGNYEVCIEPRKRFDSRSFQEKHMLGRIHASEGATVSAQAEAIPTQSCQPWANYLMLRLERLGLVGPGTYRFYRDEYMSPATPEREDNGPGCLCEHL